jgi:hypothetical protein
MTDEYVRTDAELAHQREYEAREAKRHGVILVTYKLDEFRPDGTVSALASRSSRAWVIHRHVNDQAPTKSRDFYRRSEALEYLHEEEKKDGQAAKRLGTAVHVMREGYA